MTEQSTAPIREASIAFEGTPAWREARSGAVAVAAAGYGSGADAARLAARFAKRSHGRPDLDWIARTLDGLGGHFAIVATGPNWALVAADAVRSIPVAYGRATGGWMIDACAGRLRRRLALGTDAVDPDAALALAMAGYTIDTATLYRGIDVVGPGEFVLIGNGSSVERRRYHTYRPWRADKPNYVAERAGAALAETTLTIIDSMMRTVGDRQLVIPLSAGRDSRLIVSAARHLGYDNIRCFAYGRAGNHEVEASRAIAERLGYPWRFVPMDVQFMRRYYESAAYWDYLEDVDTLQACPFVQDMPQILALKESGFVPADAVIANGNSGDYISGNHIVPAIRRSPTSGDAESQLTRIVDALFDKHFALWSSLATGANRARITRLLRASIARAGARPEAPQDDYGLFEYAELQDRQCKYVINGQRIYEHLGHEWRLPLWDRTLLDFFEAIPLEGKAGQKLYAETLEREDWGGVWRDLPINVKTIRPGWIRPLRLIAKALHAPLGRNAWHRFERRYLQYWMEIGAHSAIAPYRRVMADRRGARHGVAWLTEDYLERHGLRWDGTARDD